MKSAHILNMDPGTAKRVALKVAGLLLLAYIIYVVREIWLPLGLAFLLAMVLDPIVDRMEVRGWSRPRASAFIFGSFLVIVIGLAVLAYPFVANEVATLQRGFDKFFPDPTHAGLMRSFEHMRVSPSFAKAGVAAIESGRASLQRSSNWFGDYGMSVVANAIWIVIVPIVAFWALRDFHTILAKGLMLVPPHRRELVKMAVSEVTSVFGKYLRGLAIVSALNGIATAGLLSILHVPGALILGVVAGLLYSVPYIGALLTLVATGAVAFVGGGPSMLVVALGASVVLHQILFDQIITPRILGAQVGLHPILSIVALLVGNLLLGVMGMVLAVPVAACIQIAVLAVVPKLSQEIEIATPTPGEPVTVQQLEAETKGEHIKADATEEMHAAVTAAVESIEQAVEESTEANAAP